MKKRLLGLGVPCCLISAVTIACVCAAPAGAAELKILLPLGRTAYQTNERIDVSVVRSSAQALAASDLVLTLKGDDASRMSFRFPVAAVPAAGDARASEHLHLNGWLLRPGHYKIEVAADGAAASAEIDVFSHVRKSTFKLIPWGSSAKGAEMETMGEDSLGYNLLFLNGMGDNSIRAGVDWIQNDIQGGGAQMDMRGECDWSDPYVIRGGAARISRAALQQRRSPNVLGIHFYDELMLANGADLDNPKERTPHNVPSQLRDYKAAWGEDPISYKKVDPNKPEDVARWAQWARWKLALLDANHKLCRYAGEYVRPDFISTNQTQCWWMYFANGNYFNVARSLPVISGHCWYDFGPPDYFAPTQFLEIARARELAKPNWFLPTWFTFASPTRLEHYLSFMTNIQGVMTPPDATVHKPSSPNPGGLDQTAAIVETNKTMGKLGTIFNTMPVTRPPVAMLYSLSNNIHTEVLNMKFNGNGDKQYYAMSFVYVAGKMIQNPFFTVLDEDVIDGTLAAHHKAVVLGGIDYLDPDVVAGLESFAANGGRVLVTADCGVKIKGATPIAAKAEHPEQAKVYQLLAEKKYNDITNMMKIGDLFKMTEPLAMEIKGQLDKAGIAPVFGCDSRGIAAYRQAEGDIEYLFAANATPDFDLGARNALRAATVTISVPADGRPVYEAVLGREMAEFKKDGKSLTAQLRFGPGQMRVFTRTARPIGSVQAATPAVVTDYTAAKLPIRVQIGAALLDKTGGVLSGSAPLHIKVADPLGATRYELYRATKLGTFRDDLQLAANDPAGEWTVTVRELLTGRESTAKFAYRPAPQCGGIAGAEHRAVNCDLDREHIYRFFRTQRNVMIVKGKGDYNGPAAERIAADLAPWDVTCEIVDAAQVNKVPVLTEEQAKTWIGLDYAGKGGIKPGGENPPQVAGYAIAKPVILLGTPEDNPLIDFLNRYWFLPYAPSKDQMPGRGRGMIAWQRDGIAREQESITLIAHDAAGMAEAAGSLYEAMQGLDPLTPWRLPVSNSLAAATQSAKQPPQAEVAWQIEFPDRVLAIKPLPSGAAIVLAFDGTLARIDEKGKTAWRLGLDTGHAWSNRMDVSADGSLIVVAGRTALIGLDAKGRKLFSLTRPVPEKTGVGHAVPVITFVAVSPDGSRIADGFFDGTITVRNATGEQVWTNPGWKLENNFFYQTAVFSADSKALVTLSDKQATVLNAADGKEIGKADGADCRFQPVRVGQNILVSDGKQTASLLSPADGKIVGTIALPGVLAAAAATPQGCLLAAENDGTVRAVKAIAGKVQDQAAWSYAVPQRIVKKIAAGPLTAVAYWGGTVHLLDPVGRVKATKVFTQDVADVAWVGDRLFVGLADGRLVALK